MNLAQHPVPAPQVPILRTTPLCPHGLVEYEWTQEHITVICHLDYEAAERGSRHGGQQQEPDYPASMTLFAAYVGSIDISDQLDAEAIDAVEGLALYGVEA